MNIYEKNFLKLKQKRLNLSVWWFRANKIFFSLSLSLSLSLKCTNTFSSHTNLRLNKVFVHVSKWVCMSVCVHLLFNYLQEFWLEMDGWMWTTLVFVARRRGDRMHPRPRKTFLESHRAIDTIHTMQTEIDTYRKATAYGMAWQKRLESQLTKLLNLSVFYHGIPNRLFGSKSNLAILHSTRDERNTNHFHTLCYIPSLQSLLDTTNTSFSNIWRNFSFLFTP